MNRAELIYEQPNLGDGTHDGGALINSGRFAFLMILGADVMLYVGLIGGYLVLRGGSLSWPPPGSPKLDMMLMLWSLPALILSAVTLGMSIRSQAQNNPRKMRLALLLSLVMMVAFLAVNAVEWQRLLQAGLDVMTVFGGIYLILTGTMLLHVIVASLFATRILSISKEPGYNARSGNALTHLGYFVYLQSIVWIALFGLIYL